MDSTLIFRPAQQPLLESQAIATSSSNYSTSVIRSHQPQAPPSASSVLTIKPSPDPNSTPAAVLPPSPDAISPPQSAIVHSVFECHRNEATDILGTSSLKSISSLDSYHTARRTGSSVISDALATEGGSTIRSFYGNPVPPLVHRFTLLRPGKQKKDGAPLPFPGDGNIGPASAGWNPLELFFSSGLLMAKCDLCSKRLGWKPVLECDDCGLRFAIPICCSLSRLQTCSHRAHIKCGESAPRDCGLRTARTDVQHPTTIASSGVPLDTMSPLSKARQDAARIVDTFQAKPPAKRR